MRDRSRGGGSRVRLRPERARARAQAAAPRPGEGPARLPLGPSAPRCRKNDYIIISGSSPRHTDGGEGEGVERRGI